jgi:hypothetical protein
MMINTLSRRRFVPLALAGILLLVASVMVPVPADATLTTYTYTGNTFTSTSGTFPDPPGIGNYLTIQFTMDPPFYTIPNFTMTCGPVTLSESTSSAISVYATVFATDSNGLPTEWTIQVDSQNNGYSFGSVSPGVTGYPTDSVRYWDSNAGVLVFHSVETSGTWQAVPASTVPLPPSALLLGAGLIQLAWYRRRNRLEK